MKQTYIHPEMETVVLEAEQMLAGSDRIPFDPNEGIPASQERKNPWSCSNWSEFE